MGKYVLTQRELPLNDKYDIIVCGAGPAGCASAIAAARSGAKTLLIEATGCLGGMSTLGMVPAWCPFSDKEKIIYRGIAEEIFTKSKEAMPHVDKKRLDWVEINPEAMKVIYDDMIREAGVDVLFNTFVSDAESKDGKVTALIVSNKAGLSAYSSKVYIDCTGDGDVAAFAGAQYVSGGEGGSLQAATHCFELVGVDTEKYVNGVNMHNGNPESPIFTILESGEFEEINDPHMCQSLIKPGVVGFNAGHIWNVDPTKPETVTQALFKGRKMAHAYCKALQKFYPEAFANCFVGETAPLMGIRESRRILGDYVLTRDDYIARRTFDDEIARNSYYLDIHMSADEEKVTGHTDSKYEKGESHGIPYRCLTPKGFENLLVAGRCISTDREVYGSTRVMPVCFVTGEAAGTAAAMCCKMEKVNVHELDVKLLRETLKNNGAYFL